LERDAIVSRPSEFQRNLAEMAGASLQPECIRDGLKAAHRDDMVNPALVR
jgi:hypothetical protein